MTVAADAGARASRLYRSQQCRSAFLAGALARAAGRPASACPHPAEEGRSTWRTATRRAWERGYDSLDADEP